MQKNKNKHKKKCNTNGSCPSHGKSFSQINERMQKEKAEKKAREYENSLALWCEEQRDLKKKGLLDDYKIKKLEELPYWYW